ncbi:MAG: winged helix-turn-helix domain-containing protein, partial [Myxococcales bacterium]|nr:winged helix-turn-helix domain-containing protein [Myxococcales bacterium]
MTSPAPHSRFVLGATRVELDALAVHRDGASEALTPIEASLLQRLFDAKGATVPTGTLLEEVWGYRADTKTRTLVTTVSRVRKKIEIDAAEPTHLVTARGQGLALLGAEPLRERTSSRSRVLVGREEDVRAALEAVGQHRITVITGPVGVGKSAVAAEVAVRHEDAVRVDLHGRPTVGEIGAALAVALGERVPPDMRGILQAVADRSPGLVVLDGLDPTPDLDLVALAAVAPVLVTGP